MKLNETSECEGETIESQPCNLDTSCNSGVIELLNYESNLDLTWIIKSDCDYVHVWSEVFKTRNEKDFLSTGSGRASYIYSADEHVDLVLQNGTYLHFSSDGGISDDGFSLNWTCIDYS